MLFSMLPALFIATLAMSASLCSADVVQYIVYPVAGISPEDSRALESLLKFLAGDASLVYASLRFDQPTPAYWLAKLSESAFTTVEERPTVRLIRPNRPVAKVSSAISPIKANDTFADKHDTQLSPTATELVVLSQPSDASYNIDDYQNYVWKADLIAFDIFIYHAELGINMAHEDFLTRSGRIEWLYTPLTRNMGLDQESEVVVDGGHSTCTASKAGGMIYGASKSSTLVVVKMPNLDEGSISEVLSTILLDVITKRRQGRSVVSISWVSSATADQSGPIPDPWSQFREDLSLLQDHGVIVVCAAGNEGKELDIHGQERLWIDTYPAVFTSQRSGPGMLHALVAVSNCDMHGREAPSSQKRSFQPLFAPGVDIKCAVSSAEKGYRVDTGTSFSAPLVAGVIANLFASGDMDNLLRFHGVDRIMQITSWKRKGGQNVIWDLVDIAHNPPESWPAIGNLSLFNMTAMTPQDRLTE